MLLLPPFCPLLLAVLWTAAEYYGMLFLGCWATVGVLLLISLGAGVGTVGVCALLCPALAVLAPLEVVQYYAVVLEPLAVWRYCCPPLKVEWVCQWEAAVRAVVLPCCCQWLVV